MKNKNLLIFGNLGTVGKLIETVFRNKDKKFIGFSRKDRNGENSFKINVKNKISNNNKHIIRKSEVIIFALKKKEANSNFLKDLANLIFYEVIFPLSIINEFDDKKKIFIFINSDCIFTLKSKKIYIISKLIGYFVSTKILKKFYKSEVKTFFLTSNKSKNIKILENGLKRYL